MRSNALCVVICCTPAPHATPAGMLTGPAHRGSQVGTVDFFSSLPHAWASVCPYALAPSTSHAPKPLCQGVHPLRLSSRYQAALREGVGQGETSRSEEHTS